MFRVKKNAIITRSRIPRRMKALRDVGITRSAGTRRRRRGSDPKSTLS